MTRASATEDSDRSIAMPAPQKPMALRGLHHMMLPRLDTHSPSLRGHLDSTAAKRVLNGAGSRSPVCRKSGSLPQLSPVIEDVQSMGYRHCFQSGEEEAVMELMEIMRSHRAHAAVPAAVPLPSARKRKSSVPNLFEVGTEDDAEFAEAVVPILEPPRLACTPFKPAAIRIDVTEVPADDIDFRVIGSPVSRTKNPVPFNSPFLGRQKTNAHQTALSPRLCRGESGVELGLLSPSPELKASMIVRTSNRLVDLVSVPVMHGRPRSKSVTDIDGRIRLAFAY
ncbi:hypothetical protein HDU85_007446 [Gaertneriomyces sp. JEL0708]|nr:hypothetical protein HDU85_007446 [Gaertneriomyces sp. JEL0708]